MSVVQFYRYDDGGFNGRENFLSWKLVEIYIFHEREKLTPYEINLRVCQVPTGNTLRCSCGWCNLNCFVLDGR